MKVPEQLAVNTYIVILVSKNKVQAGSFPTFFSILNLNLKAAVSKSWSIL